VEPEPGHQAFLLNGPQGEARLLDETTDALAQGRGCLYLVPHPAKARYLTRTLLPLNQGLLDQRTVWDIESLLDDLSDLIPQRAAWLPPPGLRLLITDQISANPKQYPRLSRDGGEPFAGLSRALAELAAELAASGRQWHDIASLTPLPPGLDGAQGQEILALMSACQQRLGIPWSAKQSQAAAVAAAVGPDDIRGRFGSSSLLCLEGFAVGHPRLAPLLDALLAAFPRVLIHCDEEDEWPVWQRYSGCTQATSPSPDPAASCLLPCDERLDEVRRIAALTRQLHAEGTPLERICIAFATPADYRQLADEILPRYGLETGGSQPLGRNPLVATILAVLDAVAARYARPALLRLLSLPYVAVYFNHENQRCLLEAADFAQGTLDMAAPSSRRGWLRSISERLERLKADLERLSQGEWHSDEYDSQRLEKQLSERLEHLQRLRLALETLFEILAPLEKKQSLLQFATALRQVVAQLGLLRHLEESGAADTKSPAEISPALRRRDSRALSRFDHLLDELVGLESLFDYRSFGRDDLLAILRDCIGAAHFTPHPSLGGGPHLLSLEEAAAHPCDHLLVGGLHEGALPRPGPNELFLDETARTHLGLAGSAAAHQADRRLFDRLLARPSHQTHLFYPQNNSSTALQPSSLLEEIKNLSPKPADKDSQTGHPQPIHTAAQLHLAVAEALLHLQANDGQAYVAAALADPAHVPALKRLAHGLRLYQRRNTPKVPGRYEGVITHPELLEAIGQRFGPHHAFSVTQLETYARCPFVFMAEKLLEALPPPDPEADLSALERGNLIHNVLFRFYSERNQALSLRLEAGEIAAALDNIRQLADEAARDMRLDDFFWRQEIARITGRLEADGYMGLFPRFLELETEATSEAIPRFFEVSFGNDPHMGQRDSHSQQEAFILHDKDGDETVRLFGKIDRIDASPDGTFSVVDYKTGHLPAGLRDIQRGLSLQLPLYLLAAEALFADQGLTNAVAGIYYQMRDHQDCGPKVAIADKAERGKAYPGTTRTALDTAEFEAVLTQSHDLALDYAGALRRGRFHLTRHQPERVCGHCPYRRCCRLDPQRLRLQRREGILDP
jgi:ATP-dependent helicase/nuclease subunit B